MTSLNEELQDLTDRMEKILHEELPAAARKMAEVDECSPDLAAAVRELDDVQRALGLKTFELLRGGSRSDVAAEHVGPVLARLTGELGYSPEAPEPEAPAAPGKGEPFTMMCSYLNCRGTTGLTTCPDCSKPFCSRHADSAIHPCGDLMEP